MRKGDDLFDSIALLMMIVLLSLILSSSLFATSAANCGIRSNLKWIVAALAYFFWVQSSKSGACLFLLSSIQQISPADWPIKEVGQDEYWERCQAWRWLIFRGETMPQFAYMIHNKTVHNNQSWVKGVLWLNDEAQIQSRIQGFDFEFDHHFQWYKSKRFGWLSSLRHGMNLRQLESGMQQPLLWCVKRI